MARRPSRRAFPIREEEDVVAETRHGLERVRLERLCGRQQERHHSILGLDALDSLPPDAQTNKTGVSRDGRLHFGRLAQDDGDEETVPCTPGVQPPSPYIELVRHRADGETTKADDSPVSVCIGEGPEIWMR